jgi:hypothetical protein
MPPMRLSSKRVSKAMQKALLTPTFQVSVADPLRPRKFISPLIVDLV